MKDTIQNNEARGSSSERPSSVQKIKFWELAIDDYFYWNEKDTVLKMKSNFYWYRYAESGQAFPILVSDAPVIREDLRQLAPAHGSASVLVIGHAKSKDAHCVACGLKMRGGANVGLCPKCGSDRWYKTRL
jgi:hypothetical protein